MADAKKRKKRFSDYLREAERRYEYQVRILDVFTDEMMQVIEGLFAKYRLDKFPAKAKEIGFHRNPEGFTAHSGTVFVIDGIVTKDPVPQQAQETIASKCALPKSDVRLISENDPALEVDTMISRFGQQKEVSKLMDPDYSEAEPVDHGEWFGQEFVDNVLKDICSDSKEKPHYVFNYMNKDGTGKDGK